MIKNLRFKITPVGLVSAALVTASTATILLVASLPSDTPDARTSLPVCVHEDASGQAACYWDASNFGSDHPDAFVFESGKITFYPHTGELTIYDDKVNDVVTYKITKPE